MDSTMTPPPECDADVLCPDWPAPADVRAFVTLRTGGVSSGPWGLAGGAAGGWNLGVHCGDSPADVAENRARLRRRLPAEPLWLDQVHGAEVLDADAWVGVAGPRPAREAQPRPVADAAVTSARGRVLAVLTADCLPVLIADAHGVAVGIAHAGWRGLAAGVVERTVEALRTKGARTPVAWLGPAIGARRFEVGDDVRQAFVAHDVRAAPAFVALPVPGKWLADLYALARLRLASCGVTRVSGGGACTASDPARFYSYRRDRDTGRMASLVWID